jgi:predicted phage tail protein
MTKRLIAGAGGGGGGGKGGGGGGGGGSANVTKDNLDSRQVARIIDLLCEGEIEGFPSARGYTLGTLEYNRAMLKDVYLNNTPILRSTADPSAVQDSDYNFDTTGGVFEFRTGTQNQTYTQNVGDANQSTTVVNTKVTYNSPVTR